ncbi:hypothetical protein NEMBOFW57_009604 [Staphylotrichum longicolle]|uniref:Kinesin light chain n=1 Tax=Staphylotrichum longicolle TaxID=669026 RepID=A0AAD4HVL1_9PEZI|nr:hypothetical protein NEMBOFW57_009604 [Staphylotrichum longicolle]
MAHHSLHNFPPEKASRSPSSAPSPSKPTPSPPSFDHHWDNNNNGQNNNDNNRTYPKSPNDPNTYSTARHRPAQCPRPARATVAAHCRASFPGVRLAIVVGVCGVVPFRRPGPGPGGEDEKEEEIVLGMGGPPVVHFGVIASGDTVMMSAEHRDAVARQAGVIAFEMEGIGVWDSFPCLVIKGACDYADSHKSKGWQRYAAAAAAACMKAVLDHWEPSISESIPAVGQPAGPWFLVPYPRNDSFVGRAAVLRQLQQLPLRSASQARVALHGLGGIGKTQIALEYAYWLHEACPDISVFWVHASNADRFRQAYTSIAQECRVPGHNDPKANVFTLVKTWLESKDCRPWVMVIDNADDTHLFFGLQGDSENGSSLNHEGSLGRYIPECSHGTFLVTTRNKQAGSRLSKGKRLIEVGKMDDDETTELLCAWFDDADAASDDYSTLSSRLEHLPLALAQAAAFIQENTMTICDYVRLLDNSEQHLIDLLGEEFETAGRDSETSRAVAETWILSFEKIQEQNKLASELLSLMSLFDRQAIPFVFLSNYIEGQEGQEVNEIELTKSLGILKAFSFINENKDNEFDMHRLVQLVTQKWLVKRGTIRRFAEEAVRVVEEAYPNGKHKHREICSALMPHVYAVLKQKGSGSDDETLARAALLHRTSAFLWIQGRWKEAEPLALQVVEARKRVLGEEHFYTMGSVSDLAAIYWGQGRWKEAEALELQVVEARKRVLGEDHPDTLASMNNLATTYHTQGRWKEAETIELQVVEARKRVLGEDHPDTLASMNNLATTYHTQGRWKEAETIELQVVEERKRVLGEEHPDTLLSKGALAVTYLNQGRWKEAEAIELQVGEARKRVLGEEHPDTLSSTNNLAAIYYRRGRWGEAESLEVLVLQTRERVLGAEHPQTLTSMYNLANVWKRQDRFNDALEMMQNVNEV